MSEQEPAPADRSEPPRARRRLLLGGGFGLLLGVVAGRQGTRREARVRAG